MHLARFCKRNRHDAENDSFSASINANKIARLLDGRKTVAMSRDMSPRIFEQIHEKVRTIDLDNITYGAT
jgi:hypothetical protein